MPSEGSDFWEQAERNQPFSAIKVCFYEQPWKPLYKFWSSQRDIFALDTYVPSRTPIIKLASLLKELFAFKAVKSRNQEI